MGIFHVQGLLIFYNNKKLDPVGQHFWYNKAYALLYQKVEKKDKLKIYSNIRISGANHKKNRSDSM